MQKMGVENVNQIIKKKLFNTNHKVKNILGGKIDGK